MLVALVAAWGLAAAAAPAPPPASAPGSATKSSPPPGALDRARTHFRAGEALHALGRYEEAIREFSDGYALVPLPAFLLNIAQAHRLRGDPEGARDYYRKYVAADPKTPRRAEVEHLIAEMDAAIARRPPPPPALPASDPAAAAESAPAPLPALRDAAARDDAPRPRPLSKRWWLWTAVGVVLAGGAVAAVLLLYPPAAPAGTLATIDLR